MRKGNAMSEGTSQYSRDSEEGDHVTTSDGKSGTVTSRSGRTVTVTDGNGESSLYHQDDVTSD